MTTDRLLELQVTNLGVIEHLGLVMGPGMTAITGETGAGKTLVLTAIELLVGGRADATMVGPHDQEAVVEGRFVHDGEEIVVGRVIPAHGRSRAYLNGRLATASSLAELGAYTVEVHGQNTHQALAGTAAQRAALDRYGKVDASGLVDVRLRQSSLRHELESLGGDERSRLREAELLRFQAEEIDAARLDDPGEDEELQAVELSLGAATAHREAATQASELLGADGPVDDGLRRALAALGDRRPLEPLAGRVLELVDQLESVASLARDCCDRFDDDPERLEAIQERRRVLSDIRRKYGDRLGDVLSYRAEVGERLRVLEDHDAVAQGLQDALVRLEQEEAHAAAEVGAARRAAAPRLAKAITRQARELALPKAQLKIDVGADPGDDVRMSITMNPGMSPLPLAKVASGGELARTMLAARRVLSAEPPTMIFDEVDAGIGGQAAQVVGGALRKLAKNRQVLVVTHLPQVAAHAHHQVQVVKTESAGRVRVDAQLLLGDARIVELSRMLSGSPDSESAKEHAVELLQSSQR